MFRKFALTTAAATLAVSPIAAQAAVAERTAAPMTEQERIFGSLLWPILIAIAVGVGIWLIVDDDDEPASP